MRTLVCVLLLCLATDAVWAKCPKSVGDNGFIDSKESEISRMSEEQLLVKIAESPHKIRPEVMKGLKDACAAKSCKSCYETLVAVSYGSADNGHGVTCAKWFPKYAPDAPLPYCEEESNARMCPKAIGSSREDDRVYSTTWCKIAEDDITGLTEFYQMQAGDGGAQTAAEGLREALREKQTELDGAIKAKLDEIDQVEEALEELAEEKKTAEDEQTAYANADDWGTDRRTELTQKFHKSLRGYEDKFAGDNEFIHDSTSMKWRDDRQRMLSKITDSYQQKIDEIQRRIDEKRAEITRLSQEAVQEVENKPRILEEDWIKSEDRAGGVWSRRDERPTMAQRGQELFDTHFTPSLSVEDTRVDKARTYAKPMMW